MATAKPALKSPRLDEAEEEDAKRGNGQGERDKQQQQALEKILSIQQEIDKLNEQASEEILHVEQKYNKLRKPHYQRRAELAREIPEFWFATLINHPSISELLNEEDEGALQYLRHLSVEEFEDVKSGFKISLYFKPNPYFSNEVLSKEYVLDGSEGTIMTGTDIQWLPGADLTSRQPPPETEGRKRPHEDPPSFFCWFGDCDTSSGDEIAELIKDDIWPNPMQYYLIGDTSADDEDEDDEEEEGEGDEEDDEEEEDEEGEDELVDLEEEEGEEEEEGDEDV